MVAVIVILSATLMVTVVLTLLILGVVKLVRVQIVHVSRLGFRDVARSLSSVVKGQTAQLPVTVMSFVILLETAVTILQRLDVPKTQPHSLVSF